MSDLRDKLLKAGLVSEEAAQAAERAAEQSARPRGGRGGRGGRGRGPDRGPRGDDAAPVERWREQAAATPLEDEASQARAKALVAEGAVKVQRGNRRWYVEARDGALPSLELAREQAEQLEGGALAVVENAEGAMKLVPAAVARELATIDPRWIRRWNA